MLCVGGGRRVDEVEEVKEELYEEENDGLLSGAAYAELKSRRLSLSWDNMRKLKMINVEQNNSPFFGHNFKFI